MTSSGGSLAFIPDDSGRIASDGSGGVESKESTDSTGLGGDIADIVSRQREAERKKEREREKEREEVVVTRVAACWKRGRGGGSGSSGGGVYGVLRSVEVGKSITGSITDSLIDYTMDY